MIRIISILLFIISILLLLNVFNYYTPLTRAGSEFPLKNRVGEVNRYQISAWAAAQYDLRGYYILDTTTGEVVKSEEERISR